jgi:hypothetical protein
MRGCRAFAIAPILLALTLSLAACGRSDDTAAPGDVTVSEAKALDEAAEMIEAHRPPPPVVTPSAPLPPNVAAPPAAAGAR